MKNKIKLAVLLLVLSSTSAFAALPPLYQNIAEIKGILESEKLTDYISSADQIQEIRKDENYYTIHGNKSGCLVKVKYLPTEMVGPAKFELVFFPLSQNDK